MVKILNKPHFFFFSLIPISLIIGFILKNQTLDFAYYGGVISFNYFSIFSISAVFFALNWFKLFFFNLIKKTTKKMVNVISYNFTNPIICYTNILCVYYKKHCYRTTKRAVKFSIFYWLYSFFDFSFNSFIKFLYKLTNKNRITLLNLL